MSIGIIGGSDGPTMILVGSAVDLVWLGAGIIIVAGIGFAAGFIAGRMKKRRK